MMHHASPTTRSLPYAGFTDWLWSFVPGAAPAVTPGQQAAVDAALVQQNSTLISQMQAYQQRPTPAPVSWGTYAAVGVGGLVASLVVVDLVRRRRM